MKSQFAALLAAFLCTQAVADPPNVLTDIAPVHSLTAMVMQGVAEPKLLVPPGGSPHGYALRPSQVRALSNASLVVWIGPDLEPWLESVVEKTATDAHSLVLNDLPGTVLLPNREAHEEDGHDEAGHHDDDHAEDGHDGHEHDEDGDEAHAHDHGEFDPHTWLSTANATVWVDAIATELAELDPANADAYRSNAATARATIAALDADLSAKFASQKPAPYIAWHDAFQYFEHQYQLTSAGTIAKGDGQGATAARLATAAEQIKSGATGCIASEPQFSSEITQMMASDTGVATIVMDPHGETLMPGPLLYVEVLTGLADALAECGDG